MYVTTQSRFNINDALTQDDKTSNKCLDNESYLRSQIISDEYLTCPILSGENVKEKDKLKILFWNIHGTKNKLNEDDLQDFLFKENDIIILIETHAYENTTYNIPNFIYYNFARKHLHPDSPWSSGGIGIFVRRNLTEGIEEPFSSHESIVWIK